MLLTNAVDDEVIATNNNELRLRFLDFLEKQFDVEDMGMAHWHLQGRLTQNEDYSVVLNQSLYMALIAPRFSHNTTTRMSPKTRPSMNRHYQLLSYP